HSSMFGTMKVNAVQNPAPTIASILPSSGSIAGGTVVTIAGTGFLTNATVKFGGVAATNVSVTSTSITATAPAHAAGKVDVVVTNSDGQSATLPQSFTYVLPAPTVASVSPNTGPTSGGTPVTITGTNFQSGATVTFGALPATDVTVVSATSITARTPLGPVSSTLAVDVSVTNPDSLKGTATGAFTYTVPALAVISITPNTALPAGAAGAAATAVTIYGAGFSSASTSVTVVGVAATNVQVIDPVTIHATFAVHAAGTDDVVVTVGATSATLHNGFSWQNAPPKHRSVKH
ncbi:MAG: IPT/TIG domain-containing protein, partial [Acidobacteria bacterium]|nr:IPT/TIG domain-containing protein [Acidobacteriota bacterium]